MMSRRMIPSLLAVLIASFLAPAARAQTEAERQYQEARQAYADSQYERARALLLSAVGMEPRNVDVLALLGQAHYALGDVSAAMSAWRQTVALAPEHPLAKRMVMALSGFESDVATRFQVIRAQLRASFLDAARQDLARLRKEGVPEDFEADLLGLEAEFALLDGRPEDALVFVQRLAVRFAARAEAPRTRLLRGRALHYAGKPAGLDVLRTLQAEFTLADEGIAAALELALHEARIDPWNVTGLRTFAQSHPEHDRIHEVLVALVEAAMQRSRKAGVSAGADLSSDDQEIVRVLPLWIAARRSGEVDLLNRVIAYWRELLSNELPSTGNPSSAKPIQACEALLATVRDPVMRSRVMNARVEFLTTHALREIGMRRSFGIAFEVEPPSAFTNAVAGYRELGTEVPGDDWQGRLQQFLNAVHGTAASANSPSSWFLDRWVMDAGLGFLKTSPQVRGTHRQELLSFLLTASAQRAQQAEDAPRDFGLNALRDLQQQASPSELVWVSVVSKRLEVLARVSHAAFEENVRLGRERKNAVLTPLHEQHADLCVTLLRQWPARFDWVEQALAQVLKPWEAGHYDEVVSAWIRRIESELDGSVKLRVRSLRLAHAVRALQARFAARATAGIEHPEELEDAARSILQECMAVRSELGQDVDQAELSARFANHRKAVLDLYRNAGDDRNLERAILVKAPESTPAAEAEARFEIVQLRVSRARQELRRVKAERPEGVSELKLAEVCKQVLEELRPVFSAEEPLEQLPLCIEAMFDLGAFLEASGFRAMAREYYEQVERLVADHAVLGAQGSAGNRVAGRAALALAGAHARLGLASLQKVTEEGARQDSLGESFVTALARYRKILLEYPGTPHQHDALQGIRTIALYHVNAGSFSLAAGIYDSLSDGELPLADKASFELLAELCRLGEVMPGYASGRIDPQSERDEEQREEVDPIALGEAAGGMMTREGRFPVGPKPATGAELKRFEHVLAKQREQATRIAKLQDQAIAVVPKQGNGLPVKKTPSRAEIERIRKAFDAAYPGLLELCSRARSDAAIASRAREAILAMVQHWRSLELWNEAHALLARFLVDRPDDPQRGKLRLAMAQDALSFARSAASQAAPPRQLLEQMRKRFVSARKELELLASDESSPSEIRDEASWALAQSFLMEARVTATLSKVLARGLFARAASEVLASAVRTPLHRRRAEIPQLLWNIAMELRTQGFHQEAIQVLGDLARSYPVHALADQAGLLIAQTFQSQLAQPLRAVDAYIELNFSRGGGDVALQSAIFQIGSGLKLSRRWVEALHVLETFVDCFPAHPSAAQAHTMIGQVHEANEAWTDAIEAYGRVITEFENGDWIREARWSIASCKIHLSQYREAIEDYRRYVESWPKDARKQEIDGRVVILKQLARYQDLVDEEGQRKAFDAQYQIGRIIGGQLGYTVKAIMEYRKVFERWPESHLADDALYQIGVHYMRLSEQKKAREALLLAAEKYPSSPLADDAFFLIGSSFEQEALALANTTRGDSIERASRSAQRQAYQISQGNRRGERLRGQRELAKLKKAGKEAEEQTAYIASRKFAFDNANVQMVANWAEQQVEVLSASQMADRQDRIRASLRLAVQSFRRAASVPSGDKADEALLFMAEIFDQRLKDPDAAMKTWVEIANQYSGTNVAEDASWKIAQVYERRGDYQKAIDAYQAFLRNYRRSPKASDAQFLVAEAYEHLGKWVEAMDAYTKYTTNFPEGALVTRAQEQIGWIKTYRL